MPARGAAVALNRRQVLALHQKFPLSRSLVDDLAALDTIS
jgi:hypothetical protein